MGEGERVNRAYQTEKGRWAMHGMRGLPRESGGQGEMLSAPRDELRGVVLPSRKPRSMVSSRHGNVTRCVTTAGDGCRSSSKE